MDPAMMGVVAGSLVGVLGGVTGTAVGLARTTRPRQRALAWRMAVVIWVAVIAQVAWGLLLPMPWRFLSFGITTLMMLALPAANRRLEAAGLADTQERGTTT